MDRNVQVLGPGETAWGIQSSAEAICSEQCLARDLLIDKVGLLSAGATSYVRAIGSDASKALRILLEQSRDPIRDYTNFVNGRAFAASH